MENDQQEGHQGQGRLQTGNLDATGELPANNNGHETAEPREEIAVWSWRLRRLLRCESGQIARALAEHSHEIKQSSAAESGEPELSALSNPEIDAITDHLFLPPKEELDKLLRYEAMINKQLNHAIAELERLQRRRNGESVPAPISIDISGRA